MQDNNGLGSPKIALLIDFDNVVLGIDDPGFDVELVVNALRERGNIVLGRAYGDWYRHNRHRRKLMEQGLELVETPAFGPVIKNSADIRIALDGFEIAMTQSHIDTFCIVSGDSDFLPLIKKLQVLGKNVLVICGTRFTSDMLRRNCNEFIAYENLLAASVGASEDATTLEGAFALLHRAMDTLRERGSEIRTSTLKQMMLQLNPVFSEKNFGCSQFRQFLDKAVNKDFIKIGPRDRVSGELYVLSPEEEKQARSRGEEQITARTNGRIERVEEVSEATTEPLTDRTRRMRIRSLAAERRRERLEGVENGIPSTPEAPVEATPAAVVAPQAQAPLLEALTEEAPATQEVLEHGLTRSELMARGMRRGGKKFSGKTGRIERLAVEEPTPAPAEAETTEENLAPVEAGTVSAPEVSESQAVAEQTETQTTEAPTAEAGEPEAEERTRSSRRRRSSRRKTETAPEATEAPAAEPVTAEAEAATEAPAVETSAEEAPSTEAPAPKKPATRRTRRSTAKATTEATTAEAAPAPVEEAPATPAEGEAPAAKKPTRRRRSTTRKTGEAAAPAENSGE